MRAVLCPATAGEAVPVGLPCPAGQPARCIVQEVWRDVGGEHLQARRLDRGQRSVQLFIMQQRGPASTSAVYQRTR
jgi:hypothetical protein